MQRPVLFAGRMILSENRFPFRTGVSGSCDNRLDGHRFPEFFGRMAKSDSPGVRPGKSLTPAAERALAEAAARRAERDAQARKPAKEANGPKGPEPTRYGDWERNGIASDF
jgi:hypothetical protein